MLTIYQVVVLLITKPNKKNKLRFNPDVNHLWGHTATSWWVLSESDQQRVPAFRVPICHIFDLIWINVIRLRMYYN